jgi:hypothetical protein
MARQTLLQKVASKETDKEALARKVIAKPALVDELIAGLSEKQPGVKYGCSKVLRIASEKDPAALYPRFDRLAALLDSENSFIKWDGIRIVAELCRVDTGARFEPLFRRFFAPIRGPVMITANNTIGATAVIALAKPELADRIARELLKVEKAQYQTAECRNVALGGVIDSLDRFFDQLTNARTRAAVLRMVRRQTENSRSSTKKKAEKFLKRWASA